MTLQLEFTIEPFTDGEPGRHVQAAVDAATAAGLSVEFGPFGTAVRGDEKRLLDAVGGIVQAAMDADATRVSLQIERV